MRDLEGMLERRKRGETDFLLVDVREPAEREIVAIEGSVLIPKNEFLLGSALEQLPQDKPVVFYCKVGGRSAEVLAVAKGAGLRERPARRWWRRRVGQPDRAEPGHLLTSLSPLSGLDRDMDMIPAWLFESSASPSTAATSAR